jgi:AcrR family transcriptional regulator
VGVGITAPSIYGHFPNRESILLAVVQQAFAEPTEQLQATRAAAGSDPETRLRGRVWTMSLETRPCGR